MNLLREELEIKRKDWTKKQNRSIEWTLKIEHEFESPQAHDALLN